MFYQGITGEVAVGAKKGPGGAIETCSGFGIVPWYRGRRGLDELGGGLMWCRSCHMSKLN